MHPAIELLLARMESNPEEFAERGYGRWATIITELAQAVPPGQWKVVANKLSNIRMDKIHKQIMQELCAPDSPEQLEFDFGRAS